MEFEAFYQQEARRVLRACWLVTLDVDAAADACQEAMVRAWRRWDTLADQQPAAWVRTVAINLCRSRWRRLQRELHLSPRIPTTDPAPVGDPDLLEALRRLPVRQREALTYHYWADLSVDDTARAMGISAGSVKQHLRRARLALGSDPLLLMEED